MRKWIIGTALAGTVATGGVFGADTQVNPYIDKGTHHELPIVSDIPQGERVEIAKDRAAMTLRGWNDKYAITIEPQIPTALLGATDRPFTVPAERPLLSKKMEFKSGDVTAFIEPKSANEFDIDFTLDAKPDTNVFQYRIEGADNFEFAYQPELPPEDVLEGVGRPENVIGSYAVYHKTKADYHVGRTNYATGKIMHIYRPKAIDAKGAEVWAELNYESGVLSVTVPQKFLDEAIYPVLVDPTFGRTTLGATTNIGLCSDTSDDSRRRGFAVQHFSPGTLSTISVALDLANDPDNTATIDTIVYLNVQNGSGADSHTEVASSEQLELTITSTAAFFDFTMAGESISSNTYVLNALCNAEDLESSSDFVALAYDTRGIHDTYLENVTGAGSYAALKESPWTDSITTNTTYISMYATYSCDPSSQTCVDVIATPGYNTWTAPADVTSVDIACWGPGGGGAINSGIGGGGGGAGAYAASTGVSVTPANVYGLHIGAGGAADSSTALTDTNFASTTVVADAGVGTSNISAGAGGLASNSTGDVTADGGDGGNGHEPTDTGGGGGGAGGPNGAGADGEAGNTTAGEGGDGGTADNGSGGAGGAGGNAADGTSGTTDLDNGGGGGGGGDDGTFVGGSGGWPGGGGAGCDNCTVTQNKGADGLCILTYTADVGGGGATPTKRQSEFWMD